MSFDLVIKDGTVVTAESTYQADIGIKGETIAAIGSGLVGGKEVDAAAYNQEGLQLVSQLAGNIADPSLQEIFLASTLVIEFKRD